MQEFVIEGGHRLSGEISVSGNKNAALKMLPACLLTEEPVVLHNMPDIGDVRVLADILRSLGAEVTWTAPKTLRVHARQITSTRVDKALAQKLRASIVLAGPMLARAGAVYLPLPGGDAIGERRLDQHIAALRKMGAVVDYDGTAFDMSAHGLTGADILLTEASVTATENALLAAVLAKGTTILKNAASEPHVQDLCVMLNKMGAQIEGVGSNRLIITGVDRLHGCEARVGADFMEVGSYIGAAAVTGGDLLIKDADPQHLEMIALVFERLGVSFETRGEDVYVPAHQPMTIVPDLGNRIPIIKAQPWPAFPPDLMSIALVIATVSAGSVLFHDWMYESRFFFTDKLVRLGARITLCDPHRVLVQGPAQLHGAAHISSPDIRAGMALLLAALAAKGETRISNIQQIDKGYERVEEKLNAVGANIVRINVGELPV
ncbi:MAG: UDP-N-acetylglucosamine 1-carboxyvinyltransferase [Pleurocapsa minor GSE-CHR-MK-17-07R]|jgi:UDP-N-acetylglucosamine 1-carboxyvinyltransferase|nr:UDP-N-acetylglucosamine 1-carboxyvinyltransferase [Pleurocapsa minor GSE-CHR-MK 17-07R]